MSPAKKPSIIQDALAPADKMALMTLLMTGKMISNQRRMAHMTTELTGL